MTTCDHGQPRLVTIDSKFRIEPESRGSSLASLYHALMRSTGKVLHEHGYAVFRPRERQRYRWLLCVPKVFASSLADGHATSTSTPSSKPVRPHGATPETIGLKFVKTSSEIVESVLARSAMIRYKLLLCQTGRCR